MEEDGPTQVRGDDRGLRPSRFVRSITSGGMDVPTHRRTAAGRVEHRYPGPPSRRPTDPRPRTPVGAALHHRSSPLYREHAFGAATHEYAVKIPRFSWREPAPRSALVWRLGYPVVLIAVVVIAGLLSDAGLKNALRIKDGKVTHVQTDPTQPGFLAEVEPTPTLLIVETNASNEAVGVTAMSLAAGGKGGWVLQLPVETR